MPIQASFNNQAILQLPRISALINKADQKISNQMIDRTLRIVNNCTPCLNDMSANQKEDMQDQLIETFKYFKFIKR